MEKIWLKSYPPGVPAEIDPTRYSSVADLFEESFREYRTKPAFVCMGKQITYGELDATVAQARGVVSVERSRTRGSRRDHDAERAAVPGGDRGDSASGLCGRERESALHAARTRTSAEGQRRRSHHPARELRRHACRRLSRNTAVKHVVVAAMGDLMGTKGLIVNFVVRHVKKWCRPGAFQATSRSTP